MKDNLKQYQVKQSFSKNLVKKVFLDQSKSDEAFKTVFTWVIEEDENVKKAKEDRNITDLISFVAVPGDSGGKKVC